MTSELVAAHESGALAARRGSRRQVLLLARRTPLGTIAFAFIGVLVLVAIFAPWIAPFDPLAFHRIDRLKPPGGRYWLGADPMGRDQFSRLLYGTRVSLYVGIAPIVLSGVAGTLVGLVSGYRGHLTDAVLQRVADSFMAIPPLVIALVLVALLGPRINNVVIALAVVTLPTMNRVARAATLQVAALPYVLAVRTVGASPCRIVIRHVLPNILESVVVVGASLIGGAILAEAGLSFLGVGVRPPTPTWGNMIGGSNRVVFAIAPWLVVFPGLAIMLTVLAFNLAGDAVRDLLDPRLRQGGR